MENQPPNKQKTKKKWLIILVIFLVVLLFVGLIVFQLKKNNSNQSMIKPSPTPSLPLADSRIKVDLKPVNNGKEVILTITDFPKDLISVEYELTYTNQNGLPRGVLGTLRVENKTDKLERPITLGTCSSGRCVYDENVKNITVTLKFSTSKGPSRFQKEYSL